MSCFKMCSIDLNSWNSVGVHQDKLSKWWFYSHIKLLVCWYFTLDKFYTIEKSVFSTIRIFGLYYENCIIIINPVDNVLIVIG